MPPQKVFDPSEVKKVVFDPSEVTKAGETPPSVPKWFNSRLPSGDPMSELGMGVAGGIANTGGGILNLLPFGDKWHQGIGNIRQFLQPQTTMENLGYGGEQMAEWIAPMGWAGKLGKAAEVIPKIGRFVGPTVDAITGGILGGLQGDDPIQAGTLTGAMGGVGKAFSGAGKALAPKIRESAIMKLLQAFGVSTKQQMAKARKFIEPMLDKMPFWGSKEAIGKYAGAQLGEHQQAKALLENNIFDLRNQGVVAEPRTAIPYNPVRDEATAITREKYNAPSPQGQVPTSEYSGAAEGEQAKLMQYLMSGTEMDPAGNRWLPYETADKFISDWQDIVGKAKGYDVNAGKLHLNVNPETAAIAEGAARRQRNINWPDIANENETMSWWKNVKDVVDEAANKPPGMSTPSGHMYVGSSTGPGIIRRLLHSVLLGGAMGAAREGMNSTAFRSGGAALRNQISRFLASGVPESAIRQYLTPAVMGSRSAGRLDINPEDQLDIKSISAPDNSGMQFDWDYDPQTGQLTPRQKKQ